MGITVTCTLDGTIVSFNRGAERAFGMKSTQAVGRSIFKTIVYAKDTQEVRELFQRMLANFQLTGQVKDEVHVNCNKAGDGTVISFGWNNHLILESESGLPVAFKCDAWPIEPAALPFLNRGFFRDCLAGLSPAERASAKRLIRRLVRSHCFGDICVMLYTLQGLVGGPHALSKLLRNEFFRRLRPPNLN